MALSCAILMQHLIQPLSLSLVLSQQLSGVCLVLFKPLSPQQTQTKTVSTTHTDKTRWMPWPLRQKCFNLGPLPWWWHDNRETVCSVPIFHVLLVCRRAWGHENGHALSIPLLVKGPEWETLWSLIRALPHKRILMSLSPLVHKSLFLGCDLQFLFHFCVWVWGCKRDRGGAWLPWLYALFYFVWLLGVYSQKKERKRTSIMCIKWLINFPLNLICACILDRQQFCAATKEHLKVKALTVHIIKIKLLSWPDKV